MTRVTLDVVIEQKAGMAPFVVVPAKKVARWKLSATTTVEGTLDDVPLGRRSLKPWDDERWFVELPGGLLAALGKPVGARARLTIGLASAELPDELKQLIAEDAGARQRWDAHSDAQKRMLREHILGAKSSEARRRRAQQGLAPTVTRKAAPVAGLRSTPTTVAVRILGHHLPGRTCGPYTEVSVGLPDKGRGCPDAVISADAREARWETTVQVVDHDGAPDFRGPAVHGPRGERFFYLTWFGRQGQAAAIMFRRAKLRLDAVPARVLAASLRSGVLVGTLGLTARDGMPVAASLRPPEIDWSAK